MSHHCHALGCKKPCPPKHLMCRECWAQVPVDLQREVNSTCRERGQRVDATWAPWWRAQAKAIAHVAQIREPDDVKAAKYVQREMDFADLLETRR